MRGSVWVVKSLRFDHDATSLSKGGKNEATFVPDRSAKIPEQLIFLSAVLHSSWTASIERTLAMHASWHSICFSVGERSNTKTKRGETTSLTSLSGGN
jgi:hypothetical protein